MTDIILIISVRNPFPMCGTQCDIRFLATLIILNTIESKANPACLWGTQGSEIARVSFVTKVIKSD